MGSVRKPVRRCLCAHSHFGALAPMRKTWPMAAEDVVTTDRVETEVIGRTLVVTMVRHSKRNAIDGHMTEAIDAAMNRLDDDPDLWIGVLTGGSNMFCAGTDMAATSGRPTERGGIYGVVGRQRAKPLIAAVEGVAFGGGFEVVMACDMVVAARNARFALPEVKRSTIPGQSGLAAERGQVPPHDRD